MKIADLQHFLRSLAQFSREVAGSLERFATELEPIKDQPTGQLAELVIRAEQSLQSAAMKEAKAPRKSSGTDQEKIQAIAKEVLEFAERIASPDVNSSTIDAEIKALDKKLNKDEAIEVVKQIGITRTLRSKTEALKEIRLMLEHRKEGAYRVQAIKGHSPQSSLLALEPSEPTAIQREKGAK
jgi:hypothetical protein